MGESDACRESMADARRRFDAFRRGEIPHREFVYPLRHHTERTDFCPCEMASGGLTRLVLWQLRYTVASFALLLPWSSVKIFLLRRLGAKIGRNVYISPRVWIDPMLPELLTIKDNVLVGVGARIGLHELSIGHFRAGRVVLREGDIIGGFALIGPGVEIGSRACVAAAAVVRRDVPPGATILGNPGRIFETRPKEPSA